MKNKYQKLSIFVSASLCTLLLTFSFGVQQGGTMNDGIEHDSTQTVGKSETSVSLYKFPWYVLAPGCGRISSGSYTMKYNSIGQVFTDNAQGGSYKIYSGYISKGSSHYTEVKEIEEDQVPYSFELFQNYPNPFNPTTNIRFSLPRSGHVRLDIYNILGRRVRTLVDEALLAGHKLVTWDGKDENGNDVSSGIYFYRLQTGNFSQARKMILLK